MEAGADLLAKDSLGLTPLDLADKMEHTEVMEILRGAVDRQECGYRLRRFFSSLCSVLVTVSGTV